MSSPKHYRFDGLEVTLSEHQQVEGEPSSVTLRTNAAGVVLVDWQVKPQGGDSWELPPTSNWPPRSGVNRDALQTMLVVSEVPEEQSVSLTVEGCAAIRWQLLCLGPPLQRVPEEWEEFQLQCNVLGSSVQVENNLRVQHQEFRAELEDSDEDQELGAYVRLRLAGESSASAPQRVALEKKTLSVLMHVASKVFREEALENNFEAVGQTADMRMIIDSDAALQIFLASASVSQLAGPTIELRLQPHGAGES